MQNPEITEYTKHYIVEALLKLMSKQSFHDVTITEIVKKAGVGRATFYRNFTDKESVIKYHFENVSAKFELSQKYHPRCPEDYYDVIVSALHTLEKNKDLIKLLQSSNLDYMFLEFLNKSYIESLSYVDNVQNAFISYGYSGANYNISLQWIKSDCKEPLDKVAEALFVICFGKDAYAKLALQTERR